MNRKSISKHYHLLMRLVIILTNFHIDSSKIVAAPFNHICLPGVRGGLEPAGVLRATAPSLGSIPNPLYGAGLSLERCSCHRDPPVKPNSSCAKFRASVLLNYSCYVALELNWPYAPSLIPSLAGLKGCKPLG